MYVEGIKTTTFDGTKLEVSVERCSEGNGPIFYQVEVTRRDLEARTRGGINVHGEIIARVKSETYPEALIAYSAIIVAIEATAQLTALAVEEQA